MMIAARNAFLMSGGAGPTPWQNPYITDGLVAMWDGEWNAGGGVHDANAITWADLSNNGNDLNITAGTWAADHFVCNGAAGGKTGFINGIGTIEIVAKRTSSSTYQLAIGLNQSQSQYNRYFAISDNYANFRSSGPRLPITINAVESFACVYAGDILYKNGAAAASAGTGDYYVTGGNYNTVLGISGSGRYPFGGMIYAIRLYSRALTAAEVAANYAIDAARFGL